jgi:hypothetical protein
LVQVVFAKDDEQFVERLGREEHEENLNEEVSPLPVSDYFTFPLALFLTFNDAVENTKDV